MKLMVVAGLNGAIISMMKLAQVAGAVVQHVETASACCAVLRRDSTIGLILCDLAVDPAGLMASLARDHIAVPVIACGINATPAQAADAVRAGALDFLGLPTDTETLAALLQMTVHSSAAPVALDPAMRAVLARAEHVARADASVLICGESGTGKEVLARYIHRQSRRAGGAFVALNCAAIPEHLLESEMFGHERGAFSGAVARRVGRFESADGGTLLLDEISEMDVRLQAKLLRAIQEREIDRVGGNKPVPINVRILATTNRDLPSDIAAGRFREDLYFRLNVVCLKVPALRDRRGDIAALAAHYVRHYGRLNGLADRSLTPSAITSLVQRPWRGNVRELENAMHRAVLLAEGDVIDLAAIDQDENWPGRGTGVAPQAGPFVEKSCAEVERDHILGTLTHTFGNRTHAAGMLGISLRALRNKLRDYGDRGIAVPPPHTGVAA